jgi:hypothetical protein
VIKRWSWKQSGLTDGPKINLLVCGNWSNL